LATLSENKFPVKYAIQYLRVSTAIQSSEDKTGVARQDENFKSWLKAHPDYTAWDERFADLGKSAFKSYKSRGALTAILDLAEKGSFGLDAVLVIDDVSRLTREPSLEAFELLISLFKKGLSIAVVELGGQILKKRDDFVFVNLAGAFLVANGHSKTKSLKGRAYSKEKIEKFKRGDYSSNYSPRTKSKKKYHYPDYLDFIGEGVPAGRPLNEYWKFNQHVEMFRLAIDIALEHGPTEVSRRLYKLGYRSLRDKRKPIEDWWLRTQLMSRRLIGEYQPEESYIDENGKSKRRNNGDPITGHFLPLISEEKFQRLQDARNFRKNKKGPRPTEKKRWLFGNSIFCSHCGEKVIFSSAPSRKKSDPDGRYHYLHCSAGKKGASEICTCTKSMNAKTPHDVELEVMKRLQTFRWETFFKDEKHEKELKEAELKTNNLLAKWKELERETKHLEGRLDALIMDEKISRDVINRASELQAKATKKRDIAEKEYNTEMINLSYRRTKPRGKERAKEIETIVENFITSGREDITERNNFSRWFFDMGLVIEIDLIEEGIHVGVGTVENKRLVELDMTLEDGAVFIKDSDKFKEFKKTREEEMVEEEKLRTESKKTVESLRIKKRKEKQKKRLEESRKKFRENSKAVSDAEFDELLKQRSNGKKK